MLARTAASTPSVFPNLAIRRAVRGSESIALSFITSAIRRCAPSGAAARNDVFDVFRQAATSSLQLPARTQSSGWEEYPSHSSQGWLPR